MNGKISFYVFPVEQRNDHNNSLSPNTNKNTDTLKQNERLLSEGKYIVYYNYENDKSIASFKEEIIITKNTNKIVLSVYKLRLIVSKNENNQNNFENYRNYYWCNKKCSGHYISYYSNNKKRIEGDFISGKPILLIEYNKYDKGKIVSLYNEKWKPDKIKEYDKRGKIVTIKKYKYTKRYTIVKIFNSNGKLIEKEKFNNY